MREASRILEFLTLAFALSACGFQPMHGTQMREASRIHLATVEVKTDTSRYGQLLKAEIEDQVNPNGAHTEKLYRMEIGFSTADTALFTNPDGTSSRGDLLFNSSYTLIRIADKKTITTGTVMRTSSYNASQTADYASYVSREDAYRRGIAELAQDYKLRIANLVSTLNNPAATPPGIRTTPPPVSIIRSPQYDRETRLPGY